MIRFNYMKFPAINILLCILLFSAGSVLAQSFSASVQNGVVPAGETFQVSFDFSGNDINGISNFRAPDFRDFKKLSGPNQATSMQIINGAVTASVSFSYYLQALNPGNYTIGEAVIVYKGKTLRSRPVNIKVVKGGSSSSGSRQEDNASLKNISQNVFIKASADKYNVYRGEQVTVTYKLYTRMDMASPQLSKLPGYQGFWAEEIESPTTLNFTTEIVDGKTFHVAVLKKAALFPTQTGELYVTPFELKIPVVVPKPRKRGDIFDEFFNDPFFNRAATQTTEYNAKSNTLKISVRPLPASNVPKSFKGAVGSFTFNASVDKKNTRTNEPVTLKVIISGAGNINLLDMPDIQLPAGLEKYDPKTSQQITKSARLSGTKVAEYLIIPRYEGQKTIPPVEFSYFDPAKRTYVTLTSPEFTLNIAKGSGGGQYNISGMGKEDIRLLGIDIRYIKTGDISLGIKQNYLIEKFWFWLLVLIPVTGLGGFLYWHRSNKLLEGDVQLMRYRKAEKIARKFLDEARKSLREMNKDDFYTGISQALFGYLENKLHIPKSEFTIDLAVEQLIKQTAPDDIIQMVRSALEECEYARFAPGSGDAEPMQTMYEKAVRIIIELDRKVFANNK